MDFEWDDRKASRNLRVHGVDFLVAVKIFEDSKRLEHIDDRNAYGEDRWNTIGVASGRVLHVTYTLRENGSVIRMISARIAGRRERFDYHKTIAG